MLLEIVFQDIQIAFMFVFFIAIAWLLAEFKGMKDEMKERFGINNETLKLQLQAYERLTVFADRASLKNLISRTSSGGIGFATCGRSLSLGSVMYQTPSLCQFIGTRTFTGVRPWAVMASCHLFANPCGGLAKYTSMSQLMRILRNEWKPGSGANPRSG